MSTLETQPVRTADRRLQAVAGGRVSIVGHRYGERDYLVRRLLALADVFGLAFALVVAVTTVPAGVGVGEALLWATFTVPVWLVLFKAYGLYDRDIKRVSHTTVDDIPWLGHALLVGGLALWAYFRLVTPTGHLIFGELLVFGLVAGVLIVLLRASVRGVAARSLAPERVLFLGEDEMTRIVARKMGNHPEYGLRPVGALADAHSAAEVRTLPLLGGIADLREVIDDGSIDRVVISSSCTAAATCIDVIHEAKELNVKVSVLPQLFDALGPSVEVDDVEGITVLGINPPVLPRTSRWMKRTLDLVGASFLLLALSPLMLFIAIAIRIDSRGPALFRQGRIGKHGSVFNLLKFRTMVVDAEARAAELRHLSKDPDWLHLEHDPRITRVGRFLRLTSLDELPQLVNVVKGEMSLVGPRPLVDSENSRVRGRARSRLDLTPGITGLWQVLGRTSIPFEEMVKLDYLYVTNWSLWTDIRLILRTLPVVLTRRGAN